MNFDCNIGFDGGIPDEWMADDYAKVKEIMVPALMDGLDCSAMTEVVFLDMYVLESETCQGRPKHEHKKMNNILTKYSRRQLLTIPTQHTHTDMIGPARNQGDAGSCASFSTDTLLQYYHSRDKGEDKEFSPKFFYYMRCVNDYMTDGESPCGAGMVTEWIGELVQIVGNVYEEEYPYKNENDVDYEDTVPDDIKQKALDLVPSYMQADGTPDNWICFEPDSYGTQEEFILSMKAHLALYGPMIISVNVYSHRQCDIWNKHDKRKLGGHAMSVVGYDEEGIMI